MIRMVTWRTGGHQTPLRGSWSCQNALSINIATSPGTLPVDLMYVVLVDLVILVCLSSFTRLQNLKQWFLKYYPKPCFLSLYSLFCYHCQLIHFHLSTCRLISSLLQVSLIFCVDISITLPIFVSTHLLCCLKQCFFYLQGRQFEWIKEWRVKSELQKKNYHLCICLFPHQTLCCLSLCPHSS